jgi:hypothetical protein
LLGTSRKGAKVSTCEPAKSPGSKKRPGEQSEYPASRDAFRWIVNDWASVFRDLVQLRIWIGGIEGCEKRSALWPVLGFCNRCS